MKSFPFSENNAPQFIELSLEEQAKQAGGNYGIVSVVIEDILYA